MSRAGRAVVPVHGGMSRTTRERERKRKNTIERMDEMGKYVAKRIGYMALVFLIESFLM